MSDGSALLPATLRDPAHSGPSPRDRVVDAVIVLVVGAVAALTVLGEVVREQPPAFGWIVLDVVVAVVATLALPLRRRYPVALVLVLMAMQTVASTAAVALGVALFTVTVHRPPRLASALGLLGVPVFVVHLVVRAPDLPVASTLIGTILLGTVLFATAQAVRARRLLVLSLRERAERAEADQLRLAEETRRAERVRIAREMHDVLGHRISLLTMHAGTLAFRPDAPPAEIARSAEIIRAGARQAMTDLREVVGLLRVDVDDPATRPSLDNRPSLDTVPALLAEATDAGDRIDTSDMATPATLPTVDDAVGRAVYRVIQEGLTNARRHAPDATVRVRLAAQDRGLVIVVSTPLSGTAPSTGGGVGLVGLAERVGLAGGRLDYGPVDGTFRLNAWLPHV